MALQVLREVVKSISLSPFLSLKSDETTEFSNKEQLIVCIQWVDRSLQPHEEFIWLSTQSSTLKAIIHDVLQRMNTSIIKFRDQYYDRASSMSWCQSGVAAVLQSEGPKVVYTYCYDHALSFAYCNAVQNYV